MDAVTTATFPSSRLAVPEAILRVIIKRFAGKKGLVMALSIVSSCSSAKLDLLVMIVKEDQNNER